MSSPVIGRIERVPLREAWKHEALHFTTWLENNLDLIGDTLGLNLAAIEREQSAGDFSVDLVAQDGAGDLVIIENQLERSNHDHLGKILTYVAVVGAKRAVWIVSDCRPEHVQAVQWLNKAGSVSFHVVKLEAVRIGDSPPAPLFTLITGPSEATDEAGRVQREQNASSNRYAKFWRALLDSARSKTALHRNISPGTSNWISTSADLPQCFGLGYVVARGKGRVELYIDDPQKGKDFTEEVFHQLESKRDAIEAVFGGALSWEELPGGRACRVCERLESAVDLDDDSTWSPFIDQMVDAMIRLDTAVRPHLAAAVRATEQSMARRSESEGDDQGGAEETPGNPQGPQLGDTR